MELEYRFGADSYDMYLLAVRATPNSSLSSRTPYKVWPSALCLLARGSSDVLYVSRRLSTGMEETNARRGADER